MKPSLPNLVRLLSKQPEDRRIARRSVIALTAALLAHVGLGGAAQQGGATQPGQPGGAAQQAAPTVTAATPTHSTTIALTSDEERLIVVNREANSVSIIRVRDNNGNDIANKIVEIGVGEEPRCVAVHPNDEVAYVTNGISATVSVVDLVRRRVVRNIPSGAEPRGCALTPNGTLLYVANHTERTVSVFFTGDPLDPTPAGTVEVGRTPPRSRSRMTATTRTRTKRSS